MPLFFRRVTSYQGAAAACPRSSHSSRWAGSPRSPPAARSRSCCRSRPSAGAAWSRSGRRRWRCRWRWCSAGPGPPASSLPWTHWAEAWGSGHRWQMNVMSGGVSTTKDKRDAFKRCYKQTCLKQEEGAAAAPVSFRYLSQLKCPENNGSNDICSESEIWYE